MIVRGLDGCWSAAEVWFGEIEATGALNGRNYTGLESKDAYIIGLAGELRLEGILNEYKIRYQTKRRRDGFADAMDYCVWHNGRPFILDVKTAGEPYHVSCMMPEAQYQKRRQLGLLPHIVVAARIERDGNITFHSWATRYEVQRWIVDYPRGSKTLTRMCEFVEMRRIETLFDILDEAP